MLLLVRSLSGDDETSPAPSSCLPVAQSLSAEIQEGVDQRWTIRTDRAVRSGDFESVYFVAADIEGPGVEDDDGIAVWAIVGDIDPFRGLINSVPGFATEFSDWPDGSTTDAQLSGREDGVDEAKRCVEAALR